MGVLIVRDCAWARVSIYGSTFYFLSQRKGKKKERVKTNGKGRIAWYWKFERFHIVFPHRDGRVYFLLFETPCIFAIINQVVAS
jgi:hypothetical protein